MKVFLVALREAVKKGYSDIDLCITQIKICTYGTRYSSNIYC